MSAFETNLVAITWKGGTYQVVSQIIAHIDDAALARDGLLHDVSENSSYIDEAAILEKGSFEKYFLPESDLRREAARQWYSALSEDVAFVFIHRAQYESGLE
jgi:hypothetical protein